MSWSKQMFDLLVDADVTLFSYVPDAGNKELIEYAETDERTRAVLLTTEEEGVALCVGADLAGKRAIVCMQSSGLGNCVNFLSFIKSGRFPVLMMVTMRGEADEQNPWQKPMGQAVDPVLDAVGVTVFNIEKAEDLEPATKQAVAACYEEGNAGAIVLRQNFLGVKQF